MSTDARPRGMNAALSATAPPRPPRLPHSSLRQLFVALVLVGLAATAVVVTVAHTSAAAGYSGHIASYRSADLTFPTAGRLETVAARVGDHVTKGQLLAREDTSLAEATLEQARAMLAARESRLAALQNPLPSPAERAQLGLKDQQAQLALSSAHRAALDAGQVAATSVGQARTAFGSAQSLVAADQSRTAAVCPNGASIVVGPTSLSLPTASSGPTGELVSTGPAVASNQQLTLFVQCLALQAQQIKDNTTLADAQANLAHTQALAQQMQDTAGSAESTARLAVALSQNQLPLESSAAPAADIATAQFDLAQARGQVVAAEHTLSALTLTAPFDATVIDVNGSTGDVVGESGVHSYGGVPAQSTNTPTFSLFPPPPQANASAATPNFTPLVSVLASESMEAVVQVPESDATKVMAGGKVRVTVNALNTTVGGRLERMVPTQVRQSGPVMYDMAFSLSSIPHGLLPGMSTNVVVD